MSLYNLPNATNGLDSILIEVIAEVPSIMIMFSFFVYFFVLIVGMGMQAKRSGNADAPLWSTLAGVSTVFLNLLFSLGTGIVNPIVLSVSIAVTLFSALWLFLNKGRFE